MTGAELFASEFVIPFAELNAAWKALSKAKRLFLNNESNL